MIRSQEQPAESVGRGDAADVAPGSDRNGAIVISGRPWQFVALAGAIALTAYVLSQLSQKARDESYLVVTIAWLLAMVTYVAAVAPPRIPGRFDWAAWSRRHWGVALAVLGILAITILVRVWDIGSIPFILSGDECSQGIEALRVIRGEIRNPFGTAWLSVPTMSFYFQSLSFRLLGMEPNATTLRLPWAFVGAGSVLAAFFLTSRLRGRRIGFMTAGLLATYYLHVHYSRLGTNQIADPLFAGVALMFLCRALDRRSSLDWAMTGTVSGLAFYAYAGARFTPVLILAILGYRLVTQRRQFVSRYGLGPLIAIGAFVVAAAPMLYYWRYFPNEFNARLNAVGVIQSGWLARETEALGLGPLTILYDQFRRAALAFNCYTDRTVWYGYNQRLLDPYFGALMLLGLIYGMVRAFGSREGARFFPMVAWWWGVVLLGATLTTGPPSSQRVVGATVPVCFFIAVALDRLASLAKEAVPKLPIGPLLGIVVVGFAGLSLYTYHHEAPKRHFGGLHAEIATELAAHLNDLSADHDFYFLGAPAMYWGFATIPYLAPEARGRDIRKPLTAPPAASLKPPGRGAVFIFLPARTRELKYVRRRFPQGTIREIRASNDDEVLCTAYIVSP